MILFSFVNSYLSGIQKGLQTAHLVSQLHNKYGKDSQLKNETILIFDGGNCNNLEHLVEILSECGCQYSSFREDQKSLNGAMTCVGIIFPDSYGSKEFREQEIDNLIYVLPNLEMSSIYLRKQMTSKLEVLSRIQKMNLSR